MASKTPLLKSDGDNKSGSNGLNPVTNARSSPLEDANIFSVLTFSWVTPLIRTGKKRQLNQVDLFPIYPKHTAEFLGGRLGDAWKQAQEDEAAGGKPAKLWRCCLKVIWGSIVTIGFLTFLESCQRVGSAVVMRQLVVYLNSPHQPSVAVGYGWAILLGILGIIYPFLTHANQSIATTLGWVTRFGAMSIVDRKLLELSPGALAQTSSGQVVNLMSNDVKRFDELFFFFHYIWAAPLELLVVGLLVGFELGWLPALLGIIVLLILIPLQGWFASLFAAERDATTQFTDKRVKMTSEVLSGILAVKMFAWEPPFVKEIEEVRVEERKHIVLNSQPKAFNDGIYFASAAVAACITLVTYHYRGGKFTSSNVFYVLSLLQLPRQWMCIFFPVSILRMAEAFVSFTRIQTFISLKNPPKPSAPPAGSESAPAVVMKDASFTWDPPFGVVDMENPDKKEHSGPKANLEHSSLELQRGELLGVCGKVGCGKSTFLAAMLGDLHILSGSLQINARKTVYASQKPFIVAGTLRDNILFGSPYDPVKYQQVIEACALVRDIEEFPAGDMTEIGERGGNLSGGQKARTGLARAAYADSDLVLLDDPLSAVDPAVSRHLYEACIKGVLAGKTRVLVTHQLQFMPRCDRIAFLRDGAVQGVGTFDEMQQREDFHALMNLGGMTDDVAKAEKNAAKTDDKKGDKKEPIEAEQGAGTLVMEEERFSGGVGWKVYWSYFKNFGTWPLTAMLLLFIGGQFLINYSDWYLAGWINQEKVSSLNDWNPRALSSFELSMHSLRHLPARVLRASGGVGANPFVYIALVVVSLAVGLLRAHIWYPWAISASSRIHSSMLAGVLGAPLTWFHANPSGRIINRFSADQGNLDDMLPWAIFTFLQPLFSTVGIIVVICIGVPWMLILVGPILLILLHIRKVYLATSVETKRLEATTRSPVYASFSAALEGLPTIKAFGAQQRFTTRFEELLDKNGQGYFAWLMALQWMGFRVDLVCGCVVLTCAVVSVAAQKQFSSTLLALALSYTLQLTGTLQWTVRQSGELETQFTGAERAMDYTKLPQEGERIIRGRRPPPQWPTTGTLTLDHLTIRYRPGLDPVLSDLSLTIQGGEKVGIVGRTGAGKSTLMLALFRLVEATQGAIIIDDINTNTIGLEDLRRKLMAIPQDPALFGSSVRFNLDPFGDHSDDELWASLEAVQLKNTVTAIGGLGTNMAEFGGNFSVGERQLVCLARAVLQNHRILIMDEATANVDLETDALIQKALRERFTTNTCLMIAHRMDTIIDTDKVLVLDHGKIAEFDAPIRLLQDSNGVFTSMIEATGEASAASLRSKTKKV